MAINIIKWEDFKRSYSGTGVIDDENREIIGVDFTGVVFNGREDFGGYVFDGCKMSGSFGFTAEQFSHVDCMESGDIPAIELKGHERIPSLSESDIGNLNGLKKAQFLANLESFRDTTPPEIEFDGAEIFAGLDLHDINMSNFKGITFFQMRSAKNITGCTFPKMRVSALDDFSDLNLTDCNMELVENAAAWQFNKVKYQDGLVYPEGSYRNLFMEGKSYTGADFSKCRDMNFRQINIAKDLSGAVLPPIRISEDDMFIKDSGEQGNAKGNTAVVISKRGESLKSGFGELEFKAGKKRILTITPLIRGADFKNVKYLTEAQVEALSAIGVLNARVQLDNSPAKKIQEIAANIAMTIVPPKRGEAYAYPAGLSGLSSSISWYCYNNELDPIKFKEHFADLGVKKAALLFEELKDEIRRGVYEESHAR